MPPARRIAPDGIRGLAAAAQVGFVDHVVVQQRRGVDELDHGGELVRIRAAVSERTGGQQQQHGPQALATCTDDVFGDLVDQHHVRSEAMPDQRIDRGHVVTGECLDRGQVGKRHGRGAQGGIGRHGRNYTGQPSAPVDRTVCRISASAAR
jgi:hypothetical protein